jgi:hypothetical protein
LLNLLTRRSPFAGLLAITIGGPTTTRLEPVLQLPRHTISNMATAICIKLTTWQRVHNNDDICSRQAAGNLLQFYVGHGKCGEMYQHNKIKKLQVTKAPILFAKKSSLPNF